MIENSILVLNHNRSDLSRLCVNSILQYRNPKNTELILLENGSCDDSKELFFQYTSKHEHVRVVIFKDPVSPMKARNHGLEVATGKYILSLDNDTTWSGNVLDEMKKPMIHDPTVGVVGMCGVYLASLKHYIHIHQNRYKEDSPADATTGYCMLISRELIEKRVRFDESLELYTGEDIDFCLQARELGYRIVVKAHTPLFHLEHGSRALVNGKYDELMGKNHAKLAQKWRNKIPMNLEGLTIPLHFVHRNVALVLSLETQGIRFYDIKG